MKFKLNDKYKTSISIDDLMHGKIDSLSCISFYHNK